ncbi:MAG: hypothetical protein Q4F85_11690 [Prevotella sp.]|nr:hypothetical protein [Prevotella sp.]
MEIKKIVVSLQHKIIKDTYMLITREEALQRLKATKEAKRRKIEILKERMIQKCKANTDGEPLNVVFND